MYQFSPGTVAVYSQKKTSVLTVSCEGLATCLSVLSPSWLRHTLALHDPEQVVNGPLNKNLCKTNTGTVLEIKNTKRTKNTLILLHCNVKFAESIKCRNK